MQLLAQSPATGRLRVDPRTKLLLVCVINVAALTRVDLTASLVAFICAALLLATARSWRMLGALALLFAVCRTTRLLASEVFDDPVWHTLGAVGFFLGNYLPAVAIGAYLVSTTTPSELIEALRRLHAPEALVIPMSVMLRFFPTLAEEMTAVVQAARLRRLHSGRWGFLREPVRAIEHIMVPLLVSSTRIGDELAASALTRGLGGSRRRTSIIQLGFGTGDLLGLTMAVVIMGVFIGRLVE
ncbi:energy-coupling factor transporter transmembrane component T [Actinomyces sp.]|uniref:energy-coupling factor transporter transmembrane component T n=1 Tax=Actinomyces sp. TaxID=29317 RepID=UPI0026DAFFD4|nr:energy-coupling factor transporter transmembrane component T [Actinomyces sp.]MDO4900747.1 energy-coupling factor transporter transmembrane component T [Actinomyces sp.]